MKGGLVPSKCDVCSKPVKGCAFRCGACSFQMHPCCAMLSSEINITTHPHTLKLLPAAAVSDCGAVCGGCNRRRSGRMYRCCGCDYHLHAVCAKNFINGLHDNGIDIGKGKEKPSVLNTAARLGFQVFSEFLGGFMEGIGESVGEVFVQNIPRSSASARSTSTTTTKPPLPTSTLTTTSLPRRSS